MQSGDVQNHSIPYEALAHSFRLTSLVCMTYAILLIFMRGLLT